MSNIESENKIMTMLALKHSETSNIHYIARLIIDCIDNNKLIELRKQLSNELSKFIQIEQTDNMINKLTSVIHSECK